MAISPADEMVPTEHEQDNIVKDWPYISHPIAGWCAHCGRSHA